MFFTFGRGRYIDVLRGLAGDQVSKCGKCLSPAGLQALIFRNPDSLQAAEAFSKSSSLLSTGVYQVSSVTWDSSVTPDSQEDQSSQL